jgi:hypothetical protein
MPRPKAVRASCGKLQRSPTLVSLAGDDVVVSLAGDDVVVSLAGDDAVL